MRVATIQEAIEGAPAIINPDGEGGSTFTLLTDEAILSVVHEMAERNGWSDDEQTALYQAVVGVLESLAIEDTE